MANKTRIEWCDYTINPIKGLCPVACKDNQGYEYCYAAGERGLYKRFKWNPEIRFVPSVYNNLPSMPSRIFVGSTIELFLFDDWLEYILNRCQDFPQHTFIFLTKRPGELLKWSPFPNNCWIGASAPDYYSIFTAVRWLPKIKASVKFVSFEPLLSWWDGFSVAENKHAIEMLAKSFRIAGISWVIIGQETPIGKTTMPRIEWVEEIVEAADKTIIPVFLKNNLKSLLPIDRPFYKPIPLSGWDDNFSWELRQEFPK